MNFYKGIFFLNFNLTEFPSTLRFVTVPKEKYTLRPLSGSRHSTIRHQAQGRIRFIVVEWIAKRTGISMSHSPGPQCDLAMSSGGLARAGGERAMAHTQGGRVAGVEAQISPTPAHEPFAARAANRVENLRAW